MNLDNFRFDKQNGSYTASLLRYIKKIQKESEHEDIASVQFQCKTLDDDLNTPDIYIYDPIYNCKIHLFNQIDSDCESSYSFAKAGTFETYFFSGAGNFLYLISTTPKRDKTVTKLNFLRTLHDKLFECMGINKPFMDNRRSNYRIILKDTEMGIKLFHILDYDVGYRAIYDQSFNIIDLYYQQEELDKFLDCSLDHKKIVFAFLNVYMGNPSLRETINNATGKSYEDMTFEEMDNYLNLHRMINI